MNARSSDMSVTSAPEEVVPETTDPETAHDAQGQAGGHAVGAVKGDGAPGIRMMRPVSGEPPPPGRPPPEHEQRLLRLERQNRWMKLALVLVLLLVGLLILDRLPPDAIVRQTLMESRELKLVDADGTPRLFLRMYSRVPVLQVLDRNGKPRISMGLRFDDTPFLDLSDKRGDTRVSLEITADDKPKLELFDRNGDTSFKIQ